VVDARFLPKPFWVPDLRDLSGRDAAGQLVCAVASAARPPLWTRSCGSINSTVSGFEREGKRYLTVAVGCTGGKHRSVAIAEELARRLRDGRLAAGAQHRDLGRE
jgi:UPF0042 nucleotide-binding protein